MVMIPANMRGECLNYHIVCLRRADEEGDGEKAKKKTSICRADKYNLDK